MTGDIRKQLKAALDEAERIATGAARCDDGRGGHWTPVGLQSSHDARVDDHIAQWDPSTVLRLIERDRQLFDHYTRVVDSIEQADSTTGRSIRRIMAEVLEPEIERLRAFWLGTPDGSEERA